MFASLRHRNYRLYWIGALVANTGDWMDQVAFAWLMWELTNSAGYLGLLAFFRGIPILFFTLFGGAALPMDKTSDLVKTGFTVGGALDYKLPILPFGVRAEVMYSGFDARTLDVIGASADVNEFGANLNFVSWIPTPTAGLIRPYLTGGPSYSRLEESPTGGPGGCSSGTST